MIFSTFYYVMKANAETMKCLREIYSNMVKNPDWLDDNCVDEIYLRGCFEDKVIPKLTERQRNYIRTWAGRDHYGVTREEWAALTVFICGDHLPEKVVKYRISDYVPAFTYRGLTVTSGKPLCPFPEATLEDFSKILRCKFSTIADLIDRIVADYHYYCERVGPAAFVAGENYFARLTS